MVGNNIKCGENIGLRNPLKENSEKKELKKTQR
jgi:hypothetical protein